MESISVTSSSALTNMEDHQKHGRKRPPDRGNEILEVGGVLYVEDRDKAKQFAKTYKSFSKLPENNEEKADRLYQKKVNNISPERAIDESKKNKAAGEDDIPYEFLKNLGPKTKELILFLYNKCWKGNGIPTKWRNAIIKSLLKDGKNPKETSLIDQYP